MIHLILIKVVEYVIEHKVWKKITGLFKRSDKKDDDAVTKERDELRIKVAKLEAEIEVLIRLSNDQRKQTDVK